METHERLSRRDWIFLAICTAVFAASLYVVLNWFSAAFPEASIEFRYDRGASRPLAERVLGDLGIDTRGMKHTATFDSDNLALIFLERSVGLVRANAMMKRDVHLWYWHHRWFKPLQEEEYAVEVAPTGEIVSFSRRMPESRALPPVPVARAQQLAEAFLLRNHVPLAGLTLVAKSERNLPQRVQRIFTWESKSIHPAGAPYRFVVSVDGDAVSDYSQRVKVPDQWERSYLELRSKNFAAGNVDRIFLLITMIAALWTFIARLRRGDMSLKFLLAIGIVAIVLVTGTALNSFPITLAGYDTTDSWPAFLAKFIFLRALAPALGSAMLLIVICGSGEVLYRERLPQQLALPRLWTRRALASKRVFRSFVLGYAMVAFFLAYQVVFYLVAGHFGAWAPAEIPYDEMLNTAFPWIAVLFAGFFPALSEEFMSRAFSIPFFERILRSRVAAILVAGFIWGFGHATYPNQPFYIRGVEVGLAGVMIGFLFFRYGLLPLLIWHYTVDALYTALLLFRSHNTYYVTSAALSSFVFAVPMLISIALYIRNRGFVPDEELLNATLPVEPEPPAIESDAVTELPPSMPLVRARFLVALAAAGVLAALMAYRPLSIGDAVDYRINRDQTKAIARAHFKAVAHQPVPERVIAVPLAGFKSWDRDSPREEGGSPGGFDSVAATYLIRHGLDIHGLIDLVAHRIQAGTWTVRFFTPMQKDEYFVEVDPRTSRAIGYHRYQDERNPGPLLDQAAAQRIATRAFATYGENPNAFELKEALNFQQPNRRDWLLHFQERQPIIADAWRRITVRVAGNEVTQFTTTVKVPDEAYREAQKQTLLNVVLVLLRFAGGVALISLVVTGFVMATRHGRMPWKRAARWTAAIAIIPIAGIVTRWEWTLFSYNTSVQWQTFRFNAAVDVVLTLGLQLGGLLLALTAILALKPWAGALLSREGRARFGRSGVMAAIGAVAIFQSLRMIANWIARLFPSMANVHGFDVPGEVAVPFPALLAAGEALVTTIFVCGTVALIAHALKSAPRRWIEPTLIVGGLFCVFVDSNVTMHEAPLAIFRALLFAAGAWLIGRRILDDNPIAWPLAIFLASAAQSALDMLGNSRPDLWANGIGLIAALVIPIVFLAAPGDEMRTA
jgi:membrane protease YdiL (CAAX protease family)